MLIYDYALDPYHCAIRIITLCLFSESAIDNLDAEHARILDYYLVYPSKIEAARLPPELKSIRTAAKAAANPYRNSPSKRSAFERMKPVFYSAASGLAAAGYLNITLYERGILSCSSHDVPEELLAAAQRFRARQSKIGNFIFSDLLSLPLNGADGLKHRTGLLEHRYDIV